MRCSQHRDSSKSCRLIPALTGIPGLPDRLVKTLSIVAVVAAVAAPAIVHAADAPRRPNIVIILGDDLGYADMGAFAR